MKSSTSSAEVLKQLSDKILSEWESRVRSEIAAAAELIQPVLIDSLPHFLNNLAEALSIEHSRTLATESSSVAEEHGSERARLTRYGPDQLIKEYQILREVVLSELSSQVELTKYDLAIIQKSIDQGVCEAMNAFYLIHSSLREQFIAGLSHDLRNPLGAVKMAAELILSIIAEDTNSPTQLADMKDLAQRVVNNSKRADRMIQNLLDASVVQIGEELPLRISECDMLSIVRDVILDLSHAEQQRIHVSGVAARGQWDGDSLRRAIDNLVNNAIKYGALESPITIRVSRASKRVQVQVHNQGKPIPVDEQEHLFQVFRRSRSAKAGDKQGWGIGLALVRGVAEGHGGSISVDSSQDEGTTFTIDIPEDSRPFKGVK